MGNNPNTLFIKLLRPVIRFLFHREWKIQEMEEALRTVLLAVAEADIVRHGSEVNVSRLSIATGIHRRDVMRLWRDQLPKESTVNFLTKVIGQWQGDARFQDGRKKPRILTVEGANSEFSTLVSSVSKDINSYTVLFELERAGIVEKSERGLSLKKKSVAPNAADLTAGLELLSSDMSDLLTGIETNIFSDPSIKNLHITTAYDNIPADAAEEIKAELLKRGKAFQDSIRMYLSSFDRDINRTIEGKGTARIAVGLFSNCDVVSETAEPVQKKDKKKVVTNA